MTQRRRKEPIAEAAAAERDAPPTPAASAALTLIRRVQLLLAELGGLVRREPERMDLTTLTDDLAEIVAWLEEHRPAEVRF